MKSIRPAIPAETARRLLVECGHRCACCGQPISLEKAHIDPWNQSKDHSFENLVVFCSTCHTRSHVEKWDKKTLQSYKQNPWVLRYQQAPAPPPRATQLRLTLDTTRGEFESDKDRILAAVSAVLDTRASSLFVVSVQDGSIILTLAAPEEGVHLLKQQPWRIDLLRDLLLPIRLEGIEFTEQGEDNTMTRPDPYNEANTVEQMIIDTCSQLGWRFVPGSSLPRQPSDVFVYSMLRDALIKLNPEIAARPTGLTR